ncbi:MAG: hypothetical protein HY466_00530 [Deltaproteobacteria bacterium]|nr:hypothetical protein [Deltaproteobacteria bacterium]
MIVAALKDEIREFQEKMGVDATIHFQPALFWRGKFFNREAALLTAGIGAEKVQKSLNRVLSFYRPSFLLLVGYCGGASPVAGNGTLVLAERVVEAATENRWLTDKKMLASAEKICEAGKISHQTGGLAAVNRVICHPHEKADIGATHCAIALDMESAAVARFAGEHEIPFLAVKAVLDPVEERLPPVSENFVEDFLKNPKAMLKLPKMIYWASQARGAITKFLEGWVGLS